MTRRNLPKGRRSIASLTTPTIDVKASRISAPSTLTLKERNEFNRIVAACAPEHFRESDISLLENFVGLTLLCRATRNKPKQFAVFKEAVKLHKDLSVKLRLAPSTRSHHRTVARDGAGQPTSNETVPPWEEPYRRDELDDDE